MEIESVRIGAIKPYKANAKKHPPEQVEYIANSIREFGFKQPLVIDKDGVVVIGHGRLLAAKKLGMTEVPCVRADDLSPEQIKALRLADNKTNESKWDAGLLNIELDDITDIDMGLFGFNTSEADENPYTAVVNIPQYEPNDTIVELSECFDRTKTAEIEDAITANNELTDEEKEFLRYAAQRHTRFNFKMIADYYANASEAMQREMERQALVIIDVNNAIANGYAKLSKTIADLRGE